MLACLSCFYRTNVLFNVGSFRFLRFFSKEKEAKEMEELAEDRILPIITNSILTLKKQFLRHVPKIPPVI